MELIYLLNILGRHIWKILLLSLLAAAATYGYVNYVMQPEYKNTIVFATTTKVDLVQTAEKGYDPFAYFQAADLFAETILGWFRSPILFQDIKASVPAAKDLPLDALIKIRKQEKQNLNILFNVPDKKTAEDLGTALVAYLKDRVVKVNQAGNTTFDLVDFQSTIEPTKPSALVTAGMAGAATLLLLCFLFLLWDLLRGVVLYPQQAEDILGVQPLGNARDPQDIAALAAYAAKQDAPVVLVTTWPAKTNLALKVGQHASDDLARKTLLIDGSRDSVAILEQAGVGTRLAKVKGFFDKLKTEELSNVAMPLVPEQPLLRFIGAGKGSTPATTELAALQASNDVVLLSVTLPENPYILMQKACTMVVIVKPGATRLKTLRHIARISDAPRVLFFA